MSAQDGGPAFPSGEKTWLGDATGWDKTEPIFKGMSLRDWFAGMALQGIIAGSQGLEMSTQQFAEQAFKLSDAMMKERQT